MSFFFGREAGSPNVNPLLTMIIRHGFILIMRKLKKFIETAFDSHKCERFLEGIQVRKRQNYSSNISSNDREVRFRSRMKKGHFG